MSNYRQDNVSSVGERGPGRDGVAIRGEVGEIANMSRALCEANARLSDLTDALRRTNARLLGPLPATATNTEDAPSPESGVYLLWHGINHIRNNLEALQAQVERLNSL